MDKNTAEMRFNLLKAMHEYVRFIDDERAYMTWIYEVPDCPSDMDFRDIAEDQEMWEDVCHLFGELVKEYDNK